MVWHNVWDVLINTQAVSGFYRKSIGKDKKAQGSGSRYEAHFSILTD
jgi:hypothetical protein